MSTLESHISALSWSVRRSDTHHYLFAIQNGVPTVAKWCRQQRDAIPFISYEKAREWVVYFGDRRPCYVAERR